MLITLFVGFSTLFLPGLADVVFTAEPCDRNTFGLKPIQGDGSRYKQCGPSSRVWIVPCAPQMKFDPVEKVCKEPEEQKKVEKFRSRRPVATTPSPEEFVFSTTRPKRPRIKTKGKKKTTTPLPTTTVYTTTPPTTPPPAPPPRVIESTPEADTRKPLQPAFPRPGAGTVATTIRPEYTVKYNGENMTEEELLRRLVDLVKVQKGVAEKERSEKEEKERLWLEKSRREEERKEEERRRAMEMAEKLRREEEQRRRVEAEMQRIEEERRLAKERAEKMRIAKEREEMQRKREEEERRIEAEREEKQRKEEERRIAQEMEERRLARERAEMQRRREEEERRETQRIEEESRMAKEIEEQRRIAVERAEMERRVEERRLDRERAEKQRKEEERKRQLMEEARKEQERLERIRIEEREKKEKEAEEIMRREREKAEKERQAFNRLPSTVTSMPEFDIIRFPPGPTTSAPWVASENSWRPPVDVYSSRPETTASPRTTAAPRLMDGCIPNGDCPFSYDGDKFCGHPEDPTMYLQCTPMIGRRGRWTPRHCPPGLLFSTHLGRCEKDPYSAYNPHGRVVIPRLPEETNEVSWQGNKELPMSVTPLYPERSIQNTIDTFPRDLLPVVRPIHPEDLFTQKPEADDYEELDLSRIHPLFPRVQPTFLNNFLPFRPLYDVPKREENIIGAVFKPFIKNVALRQTKNFLDRVLSDEELKELEKEKDRLKSAGVNN